MRRFFAYLLVFILSAAGLYAKDAARLPLEVNGGMWKAGHVQGIAVDNVRREMYFSFTTMLVKTDFEGNVLGTLTGFLGHLGCLTFNQADGKVYGSLEYKDDAIGRGILKNANSDKTFETAFFIAIIDGAKIDREGIDASAGGVLKTVLVQDAVRDYEAVSGGLKHRYACSGIDGVSIGPAFGKKGGKSFLTVAYGIYGDTTRVDNDYQVLLQYDPAVLNSLSSDFSQDSFVFKGPQSPSRKCFVFTGNTNWGVQNLCYDPASGNWLMFVYKGSKSAYPNGDLYMVDGRTKPLKGQLAGSPDGESGLILPLSPKGLKDGRNGITYWNQGLGAYGSSSLGNGFFYLAVPSRENGMQGATARLFRWTGNTPSPLEQVNGYPSDAADLKILSSRLVMNHVSAVEPNDEAASEALRAQLPDGSWPDVDYVNVIFGFNAQRHLDRLNNLSLCYCCKDSRYYKDQKVLRAVADGLEFFRKADPRSGNWWYNDIGAPEDYMVPLILIKDALPHDEVMRLSSYLQDKTDNQSHRGKNRTWVSSILIHKGCIEDNAAMVRKGLKSIASTIKIETQPTEGIKSDFSIHQHRPQLYSGGYGKGLLNDYADYFLLVEGTGFETAFSGEQRKLVDDLALKGTMLFSHRDAMDFGTYGREVSRPNNIRGIPEKTLLKLKEICPDHADVYQAWIDHLHGASFPAPGNKFFWKSNIMTQHGPDYYLSAKIPSVRNNGTEMLNGENIMGYYLPLGATNIMTTGEEYKNIFPVWDWTRVPGTTAVSSAASAELRWYFFGSNVFGGGVSNGRDGVAAYVNAYQGVEARKAYFFIDGSMICLGGGITAAKTSEIRTSVNQCLSEGDCTYGGEDGVKVLDGRIRNGKVGWAYHEGVGYCFPLGGKVNIWNEEQKGSWRNVREGGDTTTVKRKVFSIWISHGDEPSGDTYCYEVIPGKDVDYFREGRFRGRFRVVENSDAAQAVESDGRIAVVFYKGGEVKFSEECSLAADVEAIVLVEKTDAGIEISVADPVYSRKEINLKLSGAFFGKAGDGKVMKFEMPRGDMAGSTVVRFVGL
ncbi:MAG: hypothetical protein IJM41_00215 [Bacteroidales bacterium]|nr:hypothetical protein [Bacteroidales bacterium]